MEDFIGRGDRSISPVIKRAWELGATNDGWWGPPPVHFKDPFVCEPSCGENYTTLV
jgi:hypothetical protein